MRHGAYIDTSALAKRYLNEPRAEEFEAFLVQQTAPTISRLGVLELLSVLGRRRRVGDFGAAIEARVNAAFHADINQGFLDVVPLEDSHVVDAIDLIKELKQHPLRTLDALHLAIARAIGAPVIATADRVMIGAATAFGFKVARFD